MSQAKYKGEEEAYIDAVLPLFSKQGLVNKN